MDTNASDEAPATTTAHSERGREPNAVARSDASPAQECDCVRFGKCKWFNVAKGWGFITPNDGGQEVFVHQSVIKMAGFRSLGEQEDVEFECKETERGLEATRVSGGQGDDCHGSTFRPRKNTKKRFRRVRCYNCGAFANHTAAECALGPQPKRCYHCHGEDHLFVDCPNRNVTQTKSSSPDNEPESTTTTSTEAAAATATAAAAAEPAT